MIYFDNAATTPLLAEVIEIMTQTLEHTYGNPSSTHSYGRDAKTLVENVRKNIAHQFHCQAHEIVFTSGGGESDNLILQNAVQHLEIKTIITSAIEHHAVTHTLEYLSKIHNINILWVKLTKNGTIDYHHLEYLLQSTDERKLVSLMYVNNETGSILDLELVGNLCRKYHALFHSDTVQGIGHYHLDFSKLPIDFAGASAHKFHGPKGVGFAYIRKGISIYPLLFGGNQEHGVRSGTENVHSIAGMGKALELAYKNIENDNNYILQLKNYFIAEIQKIIPDVTFNADSHLVENQAYHILNVRFPDTYAMFLFKLDLNGLAVSGGSACQSGSQKGSHVLKAILNEEDAQKTSVRFSFSKLNTFAEVDEAISIIKKVIYKF